MSKNRSEEGQKANKRKGKKSEETPEWVGLLELQELGGLFVFSSGFEDQAKMETQDFCLVWREKKPKATQKNCSIKDY